MRGNGWVSGKDIEDKKPIVKRKRRKPPLLTLEQELFIYNDETRHQRNT